MSSPSVLTIILNYKTADMTLRSVETALVAMQGISGEVIIVDNDSQDGSEQAISTAIETHGWGKDNRVRLIQSGHNGGFGAGNNVGIRAGLSDGSKPDFVYVLNSDAFPDPDAIRVLAQHLSDNPATGFAGSYIYGDDGETHLTTFRFPSIASEFESSIRFGPVSRVLNNSKVPLETPAGTQPVDWLAGASIMMRQSVLDEIGIFDELFFLYFEETDLCRRAHLAGHHVDFVHTSRVMHIGSVTTGMKDWDRVPGYWFESRQHYFTKNHGPFYAGFATLAHLVGGGLHWLRCLVTRRDRDVAPYFLLSLAKHDLLALGRAIFTPRRKQKSPHSQPGE